MSLLLPSHADRYQACALQIIGLKSHEEQKVQNRRWSNTPLKTQIGRMKLALDAATLAHHLHYISRSG